MKSNTDRIDLKCVNKAEIHYNYFGVHNFMIGALLQFLQQFIAKRPENQTCKITITRTNNPGFCLEEQNRLLVDL